MEIIIDSTSKPLINREYIDMGGHFDIDFDSLQDYDFWLRLAKQYSVNCIEKRLLIFYIHDDKHITTNLDNQIFRKECTNRKFYDDINKDNKTWYMSDRSLLGPCAQKRVKRKAILLWIRCVKK